MVHCGKSAHTILSLNSIFTPTTNYPRDFTWLFLVVRVRSHPFLCSEISAKMIANLAWLNSWFFLIFYISKCQSQQTSKSLSVRSMARPFNSLFGVYGWSNKFLSWLTVLSNRIPERKTPMTGRLWRPQHVSFMGAAWPRWCDVHGSVLYWKETWWDVQYVQCNRSIRDVQPL